MDLRVEIIDGADLEVDLVVDLNFRSNEIAEGDPAVEGVVEWKIELRPICVVCRSTSSSASPFSSHSLSSRVDMVVSDEIDSGVDVIDGSTTEGAAVDGASGAAVAS